MHWSVGMLLHAVCVFFSKEKKKKPVENLTLGAGVFPDTYSSQHGAVDLDYIPFMSPLCFQSEVVFCNDRFQGVKSSYCLSTAP